MKRVMYVTVGTSLFHSASWEPADALPTPIPRYECWLDDDCKQSPDARLAHPDADLIRSCLRDALKETNGTEWARKLPGELLNEQQERILLRYSAELTTILALAKSEEKGIRDFLLEYSEIRVVIDSERVGADAGEKAPPYLSRIAGLHLIAYLNEIARETKAQSCQVSGMSSTGKSQVLESIQNLVDDIESSRKRVHATDIDLVVTGGYKIYGIALANQAKPKDPRVRLIYMHEMGKELIFFDGELLEAGAMPQPRPRFRYRKRSLWE